MIFKVEYKDGNLKTQQCYVNAGNRYQAMKVATDMLRKEFIVVAIHNAAMHQITPQSLTLNFPNTSEYKYFG